MSSKAMLVGGLASILTIPIWILVVVLVPDFDFTKASPLANAVLVAGSIATMLAFGGLYYLFSGRSPLNAFMLGLGVVGIGLTLIPTDPPWSYNAGSILWGGALLIAGYLLRDSHAIWLSWLGLVVGALFVLIGVVGFTGPKNLADTVNMVSAIPAFVWAAWIGWVLVKKSRELAPASTG